MRIGIIGVGIIGSSLAERWKEHELFLHDPRRTDWGCISGAVVKDLPLLVRSSDLIVVSIKPQQWPNVAAAIGSLKGRKILSVMAGMPIALLEETGACVVRVMPNLAIKHGAGVCVYAFSDGWKASEKKEIASLLSLLGDVVEVKDESLLDVATGVSGSGIAYLLAFLKVFAEEAERRGFSSDEARQVVAGMAKGAVALLEKDSRQIGDLIAAVASKGGTTEQGLRVLQEKDVDGALREVLDRTIERCKELRQNALRQE